MFPRIIAAAAADAIIVVLGGCALGDVVGERILVGGGFRSTAAARRASLVVSVLRGIDTIVSVLGCIDTREQASLIVSVL